MALFRALPGLLTRPLRHIRTKIIVPYAGALRGLLTRPLRHIRTKIIVPFAVLTVVLAIGGAYLVTQLSFISDQGNQAPPAVLLEGGEPDPTSPSPSPTSEGPASPKAGETPTPTVVLLPTAVPPTAVPPTAAPPTAVPPTAVPTPTVVTPTDCGDLTIIGFIFSAGRVRFHITNSSSVSQTLQAVSVTWDTAYGNLLSASGNLLSASFPLDIFRGVAPPPALSINALGVDLAAGATMELRFEFENHVSRAPLAFSATFDSGCIVQFSGP